MAVKTTAKYNLIHTAPVFRVLFLKFCLIYLIGHKPYPNLPKQKSAFLFVAYLIAGRAWTKECVRISLWDSCYIFNRLTQDF